MVPVPGIWTDHHEPTAPAVVISLEWTSRRTNREAQRTGRVVTYEYRYNKIRVRNRKK